MLATSADIVLEWGRACSFTTLFGVLAWALFYWCRTMMQQLRAIAENVETPSTQQKGHGAIVMTNKQMSAVCRFSNW